LLGNGPIYRQIKHRTFEINNKEKQTTKLKKQTTPGSGTSYNNWQ